MPFDSSIYGAAGVRPKSIADFDNERMQVQNNALAMQSHALDMQTKQSNLLDMQGARDRQAQLRNALLGAGANATMEQRIQAAEGTGTPEGYAHGDTLRKTIRETQKATDDSAYTQSHTRERITNDTIAKTGFLAQLWGQVKTPDDAKAVYGRAVSLGMLTPEQVQEDAKGAKLDSAQAFAEWVAGKRSEGVSAVEQLKREMETQKFEEGKRQFGVTSSETARNHRANESVAAGQLGVSRGNLDLARQRLQTDQAAPKGIVHETDAGTMLVDPRTGQATPVTNGGVPLGKPLKDIPAAVNTAMIANKQATSKIDRALTLLSGKDVGNPTNGGMVGDTNATGFKGYLPNGMLNRIDPQGVDARAEISDIGSLKIHDRSGAAVTVSESPRLMPFIPLATDDAATVKKKLGRLRIELQGETQAMGETYSKGQGYKPSPALNPTPATPAKAGATVSNW